MDALLTCPRCHAYVQPTWPTCKICGYDPTYQGTYASIHAPKVRSPGPGFGTVLGGLVTLVLLVGACYLVGSYMVNRVNHRNDGVPRQELVSIDR